MALYLRAAVSVGTLLCPSLHTLNLRVWDGCPSSHHHLCIPAGGGEDKLRKFIHTYTSIPVLLA